jgi:hypothetical protein
MIGLDLRHATLMSNRAPEPPPTSPGIVVAGDFAPPSRSTRTIAALLLSAHAGQKARGICHVISVSRAGLKEQPFLVSHALKLQHATHAKQH